MDILVMGAGALGSVFGGLLAKAGHRIHLTGREEHMRAIALDGLTVTGLFGSAHVRDIQTATCAGEYEGREFDAILITVKSYDTAQAAAAVKGLAGPDTAVVSLQNGLGNYETLEAEFGPERTLAGRVIFGARIVKPGQVDVTVYAEPVMLGGPADIFCYDRAEELAAEFTRAGIPSQPTHEITKYIWAKLLYNCALNPLSAVLNVPYGGLLTHECSKAIMRRTVTEIFAVAMASGVELFWHEPEEYIELLFGRLIPDTAAHHSSMLQDIKAGKRTDIDALNGAVVRMGREHGIETPINEMLVCLIDSRESWIKRTQPEPAPADGEGSSKPPVGKAGKKEALPAH